MADPALVARPGTPLTPAERLALEAMRHADTIEDAARMLGKSPGTVRAQLANARSRLGVRTTRQAVARGTY